MLNKKEWDNIRVIEINKDSACVCGASLLNMYNVKYAGETQAKPTFTKELCQCRKCGTYVIVLYKIYDNNGHILPSVFRGDINDHTYNWQDLYTKEQLRLIENHLIGCTQCQRSLDEGFLSDAKFACLFRGNQSNFLEP